MKVAKNGASRWKSYNPGKFNSCTQGKRMSVLQNQEMEFGGYTIMEYF
jgi:hypothetical protein